MLSVTLSGQRADDWICTSMKRFTRASPFSVEPRRHQARARGVRAPTVGWSPSASFGGWLLSQEHTRVKAPEPNDSGAVSLHLRNQLGVPVRLADEL